MVKHSGILLGVSEKTYQTKEGKLIEITKYHNDDRHASSRFIYFYSLEGIS